MEMMIASEKHSHSSIRLAPVWGTRCAREILEGLRHDGSVDAIDKLVRTWRKR